MTHTLLTLSPRVEPYRFAPRPPPRAIAQRFSAMAQNRRAARLDECPLLVEQPTCSGNAATSVLDPGRVETFFVSQELHATGRDGPRRDRLSLFLLYRVWSQPGRNLGAALSEMNGHKARTT